MLGDPATRIERNRTPRLAEEPNKTLAIAGMAHNPLRDFNPLIRCSDDSSHGLHQPNRVTNRTGTLPLDG